MMNMGVFVSDPPNHATSYSVCIDYKKSMSASGTEVEVTPCSFLQSLVMNIIVDRPHTSVGVKSATANQTIYTCCKGQKLQVVSKGKAFVFLKKIYVFYFNMFRVPEVPEVTDWILS
ncbi:hypothetical protein AMECASPLE_030975 [Ameca splendens]|uniref:Uncharacterized protein n=1 Tax=Ameca splendens TaxID=208324 RepID=A0ABV1A1L8_9TELE